MAKRSMDVCQCLPSAFLKTWDQGCPHSIASKYIILHPSIQKTHTTQKPEDFLGPNLGEIPPKCAYMRCPSQTDQGFCGMRL